MSRGNIKVMTDANGVARVQETTGDSIKVYSVEEWAKEQAKRNGKLEKAGHEVTDELATATKERVAEKAESPKKVSAPAKAGKEKPKTKA